MSEEKSNTTSTPVSFKVENVRRPVVFYLQADNEYNVFTETKLFKSII